MLPRKVKSLYYSVASVPMAASGRLYKTFLAPRSGTVRVQLGPGQQNHLDGWINVDANIFSAKTRPEVWANLLDPLPFHDGTVDAFYSHHVIEHLPDADLPTHLAEMFRCLKPGGMIRVGGPHGQNAARKLLEGDSAWFSDFPDSRRSVGGRYANFILCRGEHLTILTPSYLQELMEDAGFSRVSEVAPARETSNPTLIDDSVLALEDEPTPDCPHTLLMEAYKP